MNRVRACAPVLVGALTVLPAAAAGDEPPFTIGVSPARLELQLGGGPASGALRVFNFGHTPADIRATVRGWDLDEHNRVRLVDPGAESIERWTILSPLEFTIPPGGFQTVRFSIRPRTRPRPGEHRAMVYFEQAPRADTSVRVIARMGVAIYAYAGEVVREGRLERVAVSTTGEHTTAEFDISSLGTAHVRMSGQWAVWPAPDYPGVAATAALGPGGGSFSTPPEPIVEAGLLPSLPVLAGSRSRLPLSLASVLAPGRYVLDVNGELGGRTLDLGIPFTVGTSHVARSEPE